MMQHLTHGNIAHIYFRLLHTEAGQGGGGAGGSAHSSDAGKTWSFVYSKRAYVIPLNFRVCIAAQVVQVAHINCVPMTCYTAKKKHTHIGGNQRCC